MEQYKVAIGPVMRAQAKLFKEELHNLVTKLQREEMNMITKEAIQENQQPRLVNIIRASIE